MKFAVFLIALGVTLVNCQRFVQDTFPGEQSFAALPRSFSSPTTPAPVVPIIKHINRVNEDGSYTFGYESGDGSYRVETRGIDGITRGKYGYIDEQGRKKEVDYLAGSDTGYEPSGQGITVPPRLPPRQHPLQPDQYTAGYDDGSYRPQEHERPRLVQQRPIPVQRSQFAAVPARAPLSAPSEQSHFSAPAALPPVSRPISPASFSAQPAPQQLSHIPQVSQQSFHHQPAPAAVPSFQSRSSLPVHSHVQQHRSGGPSPIDSFLSQALG